MDEGISCLKNIIFKIFNNAEQNGYLKILISCVLGIYGHGGGLGPVALQSLLTMKKDPFNFQLNDPFLKF